MLRHEFFLYGRGMRKKAVRKRIQAFLSVFSFQTEPDMIKCPVDVPK